jgi:hypothetical protein
MYNNVLPATGAGVTAAGSGAAALAFTGASFLWYTLAAFALLAAGAAVLRIIPKEGSKKWAVIDQDVSNGGPDRSQ